jgi:hypothetical protein
VKTATFIFSWIIWLLKEEWQPILIIIWFGVTNETELQQFYTSVKEENIQVVGTPQFEPYVLERYQVTKAEFVEKFSLDDTLKTICFSCGDISTSKNDELYIETIADAIVSKKIRNINFVRTSPAEDPIRFAAYVARYPFINGIILNGIYRVKDTRSVVATHTDLLKISKI